MVSKKPVILMFVAVIFFIGGIVMVAQYMRAPEVIRQGVRQEKRTHYTKGSASFSYPSAWKQNDIPTSPGFISVQLYDPENGIVFVASSNGKESDAKVDSALRRDTGMIVGGISGKERMWENEKAQAVVLRADHLEFGGRAYRFEMFGHMSRKVLMEKQWKDILSSVQFIAAEKEAIHAAPAASSTPAAKK